MFRLPLFGLRVLEVTSGWAGGYAGRLLADMGAEVIKVESPAGDPLRSSGQPTTTAGWWDRSPVFNHLHRNKYGCVLDITRARGWQLFLALVALSDVVIEDQALDFPHLQQANTEIIVVSLRGGSSAQKGPVTLPELSETTAGTAAAGAVALALWHRRRTGEGQQIAVDPWTNLMGHIGEQLLAGSLPEPMAPAPQGCYPCAGEDQWVAIACQDDAQFAALCAVLGQPELAADPRFSEETSRQGNQEALDNIIAAWTGQQDKETAAERLQTAGVPASPVLTVPDLFADAHLRVRGFFEPVAHSVAGTWEIEGPHWRMSESPAHIRLPAPAFGEHIHYVFGHLLGLSEEEMSALEADGITGRKPVQPAPD